VVSLETRPYAVERTLADVEAEHIQRVLLAVAGVFGFACPAFSAEAPVPGCPESEKNEADSRKGNPPPNSLVRAR